MHIIHHILLSFITFDISVLPRPLFHKAAPAHGAAFFFICGYFVNTSIFANFALKYNGINCM